LDENLIVRDTGTVYKKKKGNTNLVNRKRGSRLPGIELGLWPSPTRHSQPVIKKFLQAM